MVFCRERGMRQNSRGVGVGKDAEGIMTGGEICLPWMCGSEGRVNRNGRWVDGVTRRDGKGRC